MGKIVLNSEKCKGCALCTLVCPKKLLKIGENTNSKGIQTVEFNNSNECIGCAMCAKRCPDYAIIEVYK